MIAVVTGATSGFGAAIARRFLRVPRVRSSFSDASLRQCGSQPEMPFLLRSN
jgi:hypothetical protein